LWIAVGASLAAATVAIASEVPRKNNSFENDGIRERMVRRGGDMASWASWLCMELVLPTMSF
jgi:hypothetical protein